MKMNEQEEFSLFEPDQYNLDKEWVLQPKIYHRYKEKLVDARQDWERSKARRDLIVAELSLSIRKDPEKYNLLKITEDSVEKTVTVQKEFQQAVDKVIECRHKVDTLEAAVDSLEHRKKALENLVQLWLADYFSEPRNPKGSSREEVDNALHKMKLQREQK